MRTVQPALPVTADLTWPLRSITKSFTVTLVLKLADEGRLNLDAPVSRYLKGVPNGDAVTLRNLAAMTSGLPDYTTPALFRALEARPQRIFRGRELLAYAWRQPLKSAPGQEAVYTNANTVLLGEVVRAVTGRSFERSLRRQVLRPLGLQQTLVTPDDRRWPQPRPVGYQRDNGLLAPQLTNLSIFRAAGEMLATLPDLRRWAGMLGRGSLLSRRTAAERLQAAQPLVQGPEYDRYGLGIGEIAGWRGHTGEGLGFTALVMYEPVSRARAVITMNISNVDEGHLPTRLFRRLAQLLERDGITGQAPRASPGHQLPLKQLDAAVGKVVRRFGVPGVAAGVWLPGGRRWRLLSGDAVLASSGSQGEQPGQDQALPWLAPGPTA